MRVRSIKCPRCKVGNVQIHADLPERELLSAYERSNVPNGIWMVGECQNCHFGKIAAGEPQKAKRR